MRRLFSCVMCVGLVASASATAPEVTAKVIGSEVYFHQPLAPCEIPAAVIRIAKAVRVPLGVERLPGDCLPMRSQPGNRTITPPREKVDLTGKTVGEALTELVAADPRYRWAEADGVIVMRPVTAWMDKAHFLHRALPSFSVIDENMGAALDEWRRAMWGVDALPPAAHMRAGQRTPEGDRPFSVVVGDAVTAIDALDHIVRAHGALYWEVRFCEPRAEARYASVYLWTLEADPTGLGVPLRERRSLLNGKATDACRGKG